MSRRNFVLNEDTAAARMRARGVRALLDSELLAIAAGLPCDSTELDGLLTNFGSMTHPELVNAAPLTLEQFTTKARAERLAAIFEVARRIEASKAEVPDKLDEPRKVYDFVRPRFPYDREACLVLAVNRRNRLVRAAEISVGTANSAHMAPREVFKVAVASSASAVIICHNHPSGDPTPSPADRAITRQVKEAGELLGIELLDHVIIGTEAADPGGKGWFSFGEAGLV